MTNEEAKQNLKEWFDNDGIGEIDAVDFILALNALEKQIPKKVNIYNRFERHCECGTIVKTYQNYCSNCGQALDFNCNGSDTE